MARPLGTVFVAGHREPVRVWNVLGRADGTRPERKAALADFARALDLFADRRFAPACELLERVLTALPDDRPAQTYLDLCRQGAALPPGEDLQPQDATDKGAAQIACPWQSPPVTDSAP